VDLGDFADILLTAHAFMANTFHSPKVLITEEESRKLAEASQRVARHYDMPAVAQQTKDWIGLGLAIGAVYGPRVSAYMLEKRLGKDETEASVNPENMRVVADIVGAQPVPRVNNPFPPGVQ
jgi:hypothetical protein